MNFKRYFKNEVSEYNVIGLLMLKQVNLKGNFIIDIRLGDDESPISILKFIEGDSEEKVLYKELPVM